MSPRYKKVLATMFYNFPASIRQSVSMFLVHRNTDNQTFWFDLGFVQSVKKLYNCLTFLKILLSHVNLLNLRPRHRKEQHQKQKRQKCKNYIGAVHIVKNRQNCCHHHDQPKTRQRLAITAAEYLLSRAEPKHEYLVISTHTLSSAGKSYRRSVLIHTSPTCSRHF